MPKVERITFFESLYFHFSIIIIIIIMSCHLHGYPWPSLATFPYRSSPLAGLHSVSSHSCWMHVRAGRPAFARPYVGVHRSTSHMSLSLFLQQCPASLVRLTWIVFVIRGRWPYSWCLVGCCYLYLFKIARSILSFLLRDIFWAHIHIEYEIFKH